VDSQPQVQTMASTQQQYASYRPPQNIVPVAGVQSSGPVKKIKIVNPSDSGGNVRYTLNGSEYSIKPGDVQILADDRQWVIDFSSGGTKGDVRYTLSAGTFKFKVTQTGWDLMKAAKQQTVAKTPTPIPASDPNGTPADPVAPSTLAVTESVLPTVTEPADANTTELIVSAVKKPSSATATEPAQPNATEKSTPIVTESSAPNAAEPTIPAETKP
jgi:hypothetical protein